MNIYVAPGDATIVIDDKKYGSGTNWLSPGEHKIIASKDGFETYTEKLDVKMGDKNITILLKPVSEEALNWAAENENYYKELEKMADEQSDINIERSMSEYPEMKYLPYSSMLYSIDYQIIDNSVIIYIKSTAGYRNNAINKLYELGYDPADYTIEFSDYSNPFKEYPDE